MSETAKAVLIKACLEAGTFSATQIMEKVGESGARVGYEYVSGLLIVWYQSKLLRRIKRGGWFGPSEYSITPSFTEAACKSVYRRKRRRAKRKKLPVAKLSPSELAWRAFRGEMIIKDTDGGL